MGVFNRQWKELRKYQSERRAYANVHRALHKPTWPEGSSRDVILSMDTGIELGSPKVDSVSALLLCDREEPIDDGAITVIGDDIPELKERLVPFGKIALVSCVDTTDENLYSRYRKLETVRFGVALKGYMIKAVSQYKREWSRISHRAIEGGFSFAVLGAAHVFAYKQLDFVQSVEVVFVTRSQEDVRALRTIGDGTARIVGAMNKMIEEMESDCDECEYQDVCDEMPELKAIRNRAQGRAK